MAKCDQLHFVVVLFCFKCHPELMDLNVFDSFQLIAITIHFEAQSPLVWQ